MSIIKMTDLSLKNKRVLIREDFNVPLKEGKITSDARIQAAIPTIEMACDAGAKVILMSHLGRPEEGHYDAAFSLEPVAKRLSAELKKNVRLERDWLNGFEIGSGEIVLCENVRFCAGEKECNDELSQKMAQLADIFVMDAFGVSHRKQASTYGVAKYAPIACAGPLLMAELEALTRALQYPAHPVVAIVAGSKVSTKLALLESLLKAAERAAINAPMQGSAADIIKRAMIHVDHWLTAQHIPAKMLMQVHDELVFEVQENIVESFQKEIASLMRGAADLLVPLIADVGVGKNWDEAHN